MPFDPTDPRYASPLAAMAQDRMSGMLNQPQMKVFADTTQDGGTNYASPIMPTQNQLNRTMGMAKGGAVNDELAGIKDTIRSEFASRGLDFDRFVQNPAVMDEVGKSIQSQGNNGDTILAHINPEEAQLLKEMGGAGTINPATGLPQFAGADPSGSSVTSSNYSGGSFASNYTGGSDLGGYGGSGSGSQSWSGGGGNYNTSSMVAARAADRASVSGYTGGDGGSSNNLMASARAADRGSVSGYSSNGGGLSTVLSPMGASSRSVSLGEGNAPAPQATRPEPSVPSYNLMSGSQIGGASNLSGLGQLATVSGVTPGLGTFAPTSSGIGSVPVSGSNMGLSNVAFDDAANLPSETAVPAAGNVGPGVTGYDPTNQTFIDANGNRFVVGPTGQRQYTSFSTTAPTPGQTIVNAPGVQTEIMPELKGSPILPSGMFSTAGYPVMQPPANMIVKEQDHAPSGLQQAAAEPSQTTTSDIVAALNSNVPASQMDAAMQIMGGGANVFGLGGDFVSSAIAENNVQPSSEKDSDLMNVILGSQISPTRMAGAAPAGFTANAQPESLADVMGTAPQGNYLFSGLTPGAQLGPEQYKLTGLQQAYQKWSAENPGKAAVLNAPFMGGIDTFNMNIPGMVKEKPYGEDVVYNPETKTFTVTNPQSPALGALRQDPSLSNYLTDITKRSAPVTNWGAPAAGLMQDVSGSVSPASFADLTPLGAPSPAQAVAERDSSPTTGPSVFDTLANNIPSIVSPANAATPSLFSPTMETTFQMPGTIPLPPERPVEAPLFTGNIPVPTPRPENLLAAVEQAPAPVKAAIKAVSGTSTNPPANTDAPQTLYDKQVAELEASDMIANGMTKQEYADFIGVPVSEVKTRITTSFGPPMAEYYTKTVFEALAGMTGDKGNMSGALNLMSMFSPIGILGLGAKAGYNAYRKKRENKADGGYVSPLSSMGKR